MSKHISLFLVFTCGFVLISSTLAADSDSWGGSIGATYWKPDWTNEKSDLKSDTNGLFGPVAFLHYGKIGFGIQYFSGKFDLEFPGVTNDISADRTDLDLTISYRIADIFQLSLLYKKIDFDWSQTYKVNSTISGFGIGAGVNKVFPNNFLVYCFGYYMPGMNFDQDIELSSSYTGDADGYWLEGGVGYLIPAAHLLTKIAYRFQTIDIESNSQSWTEETDGIRVDLSYYF